MRILLVSPSQSSFVNFSRAKRTVCVALPQLAAYTPPEHELIAVDQNRGDDVFVDDIDLVAVSAMTAQAQQGYEIARYYRDRGVKVVMGGIHASVLPDEALEHVDAVCVGEGDLVWPQIIEDAAADRLQRIYKAEALIATEEIRPLRLDVVASTKTTFGHTVVQASRGCPYDCDFCTTSALFGRKYRFRPVDHVIEEIRAAKGRIILFIDDNILGSAAYCHELFERLIPLKKTWVGQASLHSATKDVQLLRLAKRSGAVGFFIGIESVNQASKAGSSSGAKLGTKELAEVSRKIKLIVDNGMMVQSSIVFGLDDDDLTVFERTVDFLQLNNVALSSFCILTPYPGTEIHRRLKEEGRLLHEDWSRYSNENVVFQPRRMTPEQLKDGSDWAGRHFYRWGAIARRTLPNRRVLPYFLGMNVFTRRANISNVNNGPGSIVPMSKSERADWRVACLPAETAAQ